VNGSEPRRKLRKKLENGTRHTKEVASSFLSEKRDGEENAGIHEIFSPKALGYRKKGRIRLV
jgi:hypothetical protein